MLKQSKKCRADSQCICIDYQKYLHRNCSCGRFPGCFRYVCLTYRYGLWCDAAYVGDTRAMSSQAFENAFTGGQYIVTVGLCLFAFATIIAWYYYGEKCVEYLSKGNKYVKLFYQIVYSLMIFWGCVASLDAVWEFADLFNGLMAVPNLIALIVLSPVIKRLSNDFFKDPDNIRPKDTDYSHLLKK